MKTPSSRVRTGATLVAFAAIATAAQAHAATARGSGVPATDPALVAAYQRDYAASDAQYAAMKAAAHGGAQAPAGAGRLWKGTWTHNFDAPPFFKFGEGGTSNPALTPEYGLSPAQLTPEYQAMYDKKVADLKKGIEWDQLSDCLPAGFPRWLTEPFLREFIVAPGETWLVTEQQSEVRRVYTDGRGHVPEDEAYPLWEGDSIGFWDGDTLVIHTNHVKPGQYQRGQPDYSDQTSTVEMMRQISPTKIRDDITVYDPKSLTKPYRATFVYDKVDNPPRINMWSCNENNNVVKTAQGASDFVLPGEKGYKDPNHLEQGAQK